MNSISKKIALSSIFAIVNILGGFLAFSFKLPIYLDCIGTMAATKYLGLKYGLLTAAVSAIINFTYDAYAIYYLPVSLIIACTTYFSTKDFIKNSNVVIKSIFISVPAAIVAAVITAKVFGGVTSSGSSIILQALTKLGVPMSLSAFIVQLPTDILDKGVSLLISDRIGRSIAQFEQKK